MFPMSHIMIPNKFEFTLEVKPLQHQIGCNNILEQPKCNSNYIEIENFILMFLLYSAL